jgi:hypothetical protein
MFLFNMPLLSLFVFATAKHSPFQSLKERIPLSAYHRLTPRISQHWDM